MIATLATLLTLTGPQQTALIYSLQNWIAGDIRDEIAGIVRRLELKASKAQDLEAILAFAPIALRQVQTKRRWLILTRAYEKLGVTPDIREAVTSHQAAEQIRAMLAPPPPAPEPVQPPPPVARCGNGAKCVHHATGAGRQWSCGPDAYTGGAPLPPSMQDPPPAPLPPGHSGPIPGLAAALAIQDTPIGAGPDDPDLDFGPVARVPGAPPSKPFPVDLGEQGHGPIGVPFQATVSYYAAAPSDMIVVDDPLQGMTDPKAREAVKGWLETTMAKRASTSPAPVDTAAALFALYGEAQAEGLSMMDLGRAAHDWPLITAAVWDGIKRRAQGGDLDRGTHYAQRALLIRADQFIARHRALGASQEGAEAMALDVYRGRAGRFDDPALQDLAEGLIR